MTPKSSKLGRFFPVQVKTQSEQSVGDSRGNSQQAMRTSMSSEKQLPSQYMLKIKSLTIFEEPVSGRIHDRRPVELKDTEVYTRNKQSRPVANMVSEYGFPFLTARSKHGPKTARMVSSHKSSSQERLLRMSKLDFTFR